MGIISHTVALLRWLLGLLAFYAALFVREDEDGTIQNRLENWWLRLMYARDSALSKATRFMQGIAYLSDRTFDTIMGKRLLSFQAVGTSLWFSLASFWLAGSIAAHIPRIAPHQAISPYV